MPHTFHESEGFAGRIEFKSVRSPSTAKSIIVLTGGTSNAQKFNIRSLSRAGVVFLMASCGTYEYYATDTNSQTVIFGVGPDDSSVTHTFCLELRNLSVPGKKSFNLQRVSIVVYTISDVVL